jgi:hypothetical protein
MADTSSHYHWDNSTVIQDMVVTKGVGGRVSATIFAPEDVSNHGKLATLQEDLVRLHGIYTYPQTVDGKPALVAKNIGKAERLVEALSSLELVSDTPKIEEAKLSNKEAPSFAERLDDFKRQHGVRVWSAIGMMGHLTALCTLGLPDPVAKKLGIPAGEGSKMWRDNAILNIINCSLYLWKGNGNRGFQSDPVLSKLHYMFAENGIDLEKTSMEDAVKLYETNKPFAKKFDQFLGDNVMWFTEMIGIVNNVKTGFAAVDNKQMGLALMSLLAFCGSTYATVVKEVPIKEQPPEVMDTWQGRITAFLQSIPFQVNIGSNAAGLFSLGSDSYNRYKMFTDVSFKDSLQQDYVKAQNNLNTFTASMGNVDATNSEALKESAQTLKKLVGERDGTKSIVSLSDKNDIVWKGHAAMTGLYVLCNMAGLALASKAAPEEHDAFMKYEELFSRTAQAIRSHPNPEEQQKMIDLAGTGLAAMHQDVRGLKAEDISDHIRQQLQEMEHNPFVPKVEHLQSVTKFNADNAITPTQGRLNIASKSAPIPTIDATSAMDRALLSQTPPSMAIH